MKPRLKPSEGAGPHIDDEQRYDVLVLPANAGFRAANNAIRSLVMTLNFRGFAKPIDEAITKDWVEVYCEPGPAAHEVFYERAYTGPDPVFHECMLYAGTEPIELDYGPQRPVYFCLEFRGCVYQEPLGPFRKILKDSLHFRATVFTREHTELPPHRNAEDAPDDKKKKKERGPGVVGHDIQEW